VLKRGAEFFVEYVALDILMDADGACGGLLAWCMEDGSLPSLPRAQDRYGDRRIRSRLFFLHCSPYCTGDGNAMVPSGRDYHCRIWSSRQFHPTGIYGVGCLDHRGCARRGGFFTNANGERFMERYAPSAKDLAGRDVVCRAMTLEILEGRGCGPNKDYIRTASFRTCRRTCWKHVCRASWKPLAFSPAWM